MGTVFLVADGPPAASRPDRYALKAFDKRSAKPDADRRARWEINVLSRLAHPHLPSLLGFTETDDLLAWAVPYCSGGDLNELRYSLPDRIFSPAAIRFYIAEIVSAIAELHAAGVVYRDLKPENVLLRADGHVILTDFDLSRLLHHRPTSASSSPSPPPPPSHRGHNRRARVAARSDSLVGQAKSRPPQPWSAPSPSPRQQLQNLVRYLMGSDGALAKKTKSARALGARRPRRGRRGSRTLVTRFRSRRLKNGLLD
ncbi:hypothetical protein PVAP13_1KG027905 [Panicum virgatum]|uniref:non-specific serine/threonine protein kinase n=2 Tax=Panicum virgatum TaxID=38727 RepID=A0A8T0XKJ6_PANVG|nr:hypothetical protein PVAP13_1KG027905 [Panicum virgatum]